VTFGRGRGGGVPASPTTNTNMPYGMGPEAAQDERILDPSGGPLPKPSSNAKAQSDFAHGGAAPHQVIHNHYHGPGRPLTAGSASAYDNGMGVRTFGGGEGEGQPTSPEIDHERKSTVKKWIGTYHHDEAIRDLDPGVTLKEAFETRRSPGRGLNVDTKHLAQDGEDTDNRDDMAATVKTPVGLRHHPEKLKEIREIRKDKRNRAFMV